MTEKEEKEKKTVGEIVEKKVKSRLTPYEWRVLRERIKERVRKSMKESLYEFQREFRKQVATFITGSFAFVAALLWRDTIKYLVDEYEEALSRSLPIKEEWFVQFFITIAVTIVAVIVIFLITKLIKPKES